ncbi:hypothetical protein IAR50_002617 [Cryptococcus sp. DSM 104548]
MPIPPRPIPNHRHRAPPRPSTSNRPGSNVPRKSLPSASAFCSGSSGEWRAEMALLPELRASSAGAGGRFGALSPSAAPSGTPGGRGGALIREGGRQSPFLSPGEGESRETDGRREVSLEKLIDDGRGKREKRATTAATLGFDFIPNPSVIALPDNEGEAGKVKPGLLTSTKSSALAPAPASAASASPALSATPTTPALFPTPLHPDPLSASLSASDSESEEDDWEHVSMFGRAEEEDEEGEREGEGERDENVDSDGEEDVIVLGEMEMEEDMAGLRLVAPAPSGKEKEGKKEKRGKVSYAAAALGVRA